MTSLFDLSGKSAVITGSTKGIGLAIANQFAAHGAKVAISSRKAGPCEQVASDINARYGAGTAISAPANISSKADLQGLVDAANAAFGKIDIVVCNAASNPYFGPMAGISDDQFTKILQNNIISNHWLMQMVAPQMMERREGSMIIVSSIGGLRASTVIGAYCISKAADFQLARNLAAEWGPFGIRVNCIAPGSIEFPGGLWEKRRLAGDPLYTRILAGIPFGRLGTPEEVADVALFLASSHARWVTGQTIAVDGGQVLGA